MQSTPIKSGTQGTGQGIRLNNMSDLSDLSELSELYELSELSDS